jgi:fibronectin-binding autotransporter adhesin
MANYFARKAGNINATDVWATTPAGSAADVWSTFTSSDVLHANNFAITVNVSTTVATVRNDNANSATQGGSFTLSNGVTLTANVIGGAASANCVIFAGTSGNSASIVGNITAGSGNDAVRNNSSGTLNVTGNFTATTGSAWAACSNISTGTVNITGNVTGGSVGNSFGLDNFATGTVNITGNVTGGSGATSFGARNNSTGTLTITGSAFGSNAAAGAQNTSTGILNVTRAVGNDWGIGATGMTSQVGVISNLVGSQTRVEQFEYGLLGQAPTSGAVSCPDQTSNVCLAHRLSSTKKTLIDAASAAGALPSAANVRSGTTFNFGNTTGTLAVPAAGSVALGVAVDNTTGTAVLTPSAVWNALTSGMTTSGSIGARLKNAATLDSTGQQLADALSPVP